MLDRPDVSPAAALAGDPARARMLAALMDGQALTATELALEAGVAPSTASSHLGRLVAGGWLGLVRQGRHRYYRLAGANVAAALEALMAVSRSAPRRSRRPGPAEDGLRRARVCYDHLAGTLGVDLMEGLRRRGVLSGSERRLEVTRTGAGWLLTLGVDVDGLRRGRRPVARGCLDWSERRYHLAGALGAAVLERFLALRYVRRETGSRALAVSPRGEAFLQSLR
jgi:DNA-binding transcriptional ArsR family regulator